MASAGVRELRASELLRRVEAGETIQITDRGRPVALLSPTPEGGPYQQMVTSGEIERATRRFDDPPEPVELEPGVELPSVTRARLREHERCRPPSTWTRPRSSSSPFANRKRTRSVAISAAAVLGSQVPLRGSRCCGRFWTRVRQHGKPGVERSPILIWCVLRIGYSTSRVGSGHSSYAPSMLFTWRRRSDSALISAGCAHTTT